MRKEIEKHILTLAKNAAEAKFDTSRVDQAPSKSALEYAVAARELSDIVNYYITHDTVPCGDICGQPNCCATTSCVSEAVKTLSEAFKVDMHFAWTWHCNIAMSYVDEGGTSETANSAAARFMKLAFGVDTKQCEEYPK